ncbi:Hypothetical predicted protein [Mytilus galloprovincialis]|uniref:Uncharacterized protein n=1 Tax=Mytilus galloprovincialis TaxID=29158 RepID=A0A8B6FSU4_MYTGA|nr:Hypothetical predicted protein [Mytilus galloprovincialis]
MSAIKFKHFLVFISIVYGFINCKSCDKKAYQSIQLMKKATLNPTVPERYAKSFGECAFCKQTCNCECVRQTCVDTRCCDSGFRISNFFVPCCLESKPVFGRFTFLAYLQEIILTMHDNK